MLEKINQQIQREKSCIEDLIKEITMHTQEGRYEEAARLGQDLQKSIFSIQTLERQKLLYQAALKSMGSGEAI